MFVNSLTAHDKYSLRNSEDSRQVLQMQLIINFFKLFTAFLKYKSNLQFFFKKEEPNSLCFAEIRNCKEIG